MKGSCSVSEFKTLDKKSFVKFLYLDCLFLSNSNFHLKNSNRLNVHSFVQNLQKLCLGIFSAANSIYWTQCLKLCNISNFVLRPIKILCLGQLFLGTFCLLYHKLVSNYNFSYILLFFLFCYKTK